MAWWKRAQEREVRSSLASLGAWTRPVMEESAVELDIPSIKDLRDMDTQTMEAGRQFSREQHEFATSKFHDLGYQYVYGRVLEGFRNRPTRVLEIGIGVNDPSVPSGMHVGHRPGTSVQGWVHYLPSAEVHGADVDRRALVKSPHFTTHWVDQLSNESLAVLAATVGAPLDLIVDDGLHTPEANAKSLAALLPLLAPTGIFVVEDIMVEFDYLWTKEIPELLSPAFRVDFYSGRLLGSLLKKPRKVLSGMAVISWVRGTEL